MDPVRDEVAVKSAIAYVPDQVAFYPWMTVRDTLDYVASFRDRWNDEVEAALLDRFRLDPRQKTSHLSKGQKTQLALTSAIAADPKVLILDEPTSGLDPIVRREFIETVIGAYQESGGAEPRTVFVSTHLISEFEGLIDQFTIIDQGREVLTLGADEARGRYQKVYARYSEMTTEIDLRGAVRHTRRGREIEAIIEMGGTGARFGADVLGRMRAASPEVLNVEALTLEEIFVATLSGQGSVA
jgi:ABC-2 type transport system ATP-binding protein